MSDDNNTPAPGGESPQVYALLGLIVIVLAFVCVLYALTPADGRGQLLNKLAAAIPAVGVLFASVASYFGVRKMRADHGQKLDQITHQTNGVLTKRIEDIVLDKVPAVVVAALEDRFPRSNPWDGANRRGVPQQRKTPAKPAKKTGASK